MEATLRTRGAHIMVAGVDSANDGSLRFHARAGFLQTGRMPEVGQRATGSLGDDRGARLPIERLAVYEPSYMVDGTRLLPLDDLDECLSALVREGRRDDAVALFSTEAVGLPTAIVEGMRAPVWGLLTALAHTLPYDLAVHHGYRLPTGRLAELELPLLALDGSESFPWIRATARAVAQAVRGARHLTLEGQDHSVLQHPEALRPALVEFFS